MTKLIRLTAALLLFTGCEITVDEAAQDASPAPAICAPEDCGPAAAIALLCEDGTSPALICERTDAGECGWRQPPCDDTVPCAPDDCDAAPAIACENGGVPLECVQNDGACVWRDTGCPDPTPDTCALPAVPGPCEAYMPSWYFNAEAGACAEFVYGGCMGNDNRFESREACETRCDPAPADVECGALIGVVCAETSVCIFGSGCGFDDGTGTCKPRPQACDLEYAPICGCDGKSWGNACEAATAGVDVQYVGECQLEEGCRGDGDCAENQWCETPVGQCGELGECQPRSDLGDCAGNYEPLCGCDGQTYSNRCVAGQSAASIRQAGECPDG